LTEELRKFYKAATFFIAFIYWSMVGLDIGAKPSIFPVGLTSSFTFQTET